MRLDLLSRLYAGPGPYAAVYLDTTSAVEDAARQIELRWRGLRANLAEQGADQETLAAMDDVVGTDHGAGDGQVVIAAHGRVLLNQWLPHPPRRDVADWSRLPHVMPLLVQLADTVPYVLVVSDRLGADITAYGDFGERELEREVEGSTYELHKVSVGGWAQRKYENRSENRWETNARGVAAEVSAMAERVDARLIIAAGEVRAVTYLTEHLPTALQGRLVSVDEGGRAAGSSEESLAVRVQRLVAEAAVREALSAVEELEEELGQHDRAVQGMAATVEALRRAQPGTIFLPAGDDVGRLYVGAQAMELATDPRELTDLGVTGVWEDRADAAIVRAAVATSAELILLPGDQTSLAEGVGALLRYADAATPA